MLIYCFVFKYYINQQKEGEKEQNKKRKKGKKERGLGGETGCLKLAKFRASQERRASGN